jgi:hypothetical protein
MARHGRASKLPLQQLRAVVFTVGLLGIFPKKKGVGSTPLFCIRLGYWSRTDICSLCFHPASLRHPQVCRSC